MKRLMISGFAAVALLAIAAVMLHSYSLPGVATTRMAEQGSSSTDTNNLVSKEFEDISGANSGSPKR